MKILRCAFKATLIQPRFLKKNLIRLTVSALLVFSVPLLGGFDGGGSDDPAANVPLHAAISAPGSANERTAVAISATGSSGADSSIAAYKWSLDNPDNIDVAIEDPAAVTTQLILGEVQTTADITLTLRVTDNAGATASAQATIRIVEIDAAKLPPRPDAQAGMQTVQGIDTNGNGVRDDVEHSLYDLYPLDTPRREILLVGAQGLQMQVLAGGAGKQDARDAAAQRTGEFAACAVAGIDILTLQRDIAAVERFTVNTSAREQAYRDFQVSMSGTIHDAIDVVYLNQIGEIGTIRQRLFMKGDSNEHAQER